MLFGNANFWGPHAAHFYKAVHVRRRFSSEIIKKTIKTFHFWYNVEAVWHLPFSNHVHVPNVCGTNLLSSFAALKIKRWDFGSCFWEHMTMNVVQLEQLPTSLETRYEELVTVTSLSQSLKVGIEIPLFKLQRFSKLCGIALNDFRCATVSHSSAWRKSWDKHDFNEVASSILARNIIIKIYWWPSNSSNIYVKPHSVILTYILILVHFCDDINMLPQWF
jgi:hypothetical protein